jgi:hypothetical protein
MKKKLFFIFLTLLTIINLSAFGTLIYNKIFPEKKPVVSQEICSPVLMDSLKLSEKQYCEMKECQCSFKDKITALSMNIREQKVELIKLLNQEKPDSIKIYTLLSRIDSLQSLHLRATTNNLMKHCRIMNDTQRTKLCSMILDEFSIQNDAKCINKPKQ